MQFFCDPYRIQTCNLLIRSQMLYSVELWSLLFGSDRDRIQTCNLLIRSQMLYSVKLRGQYFKTTKPPELPCGLRGAL